MVLKMNNLNNLTNKQLASKFFELNLEEQLTELFEIDNNVSFKHQTPDEISAIMLNKIGYKK